MPLMPKKVGVSNHPYGLLSGNCTATSLCHIEVGGGSLLKRKTADLESATNRRAEIDSQA